MLCEPVTRKWCLKQIKTKKGLSKKNAEPATFQKLLCAVTQIKVTLTLYAIFFPLILIFLIDKVNQWTNQPKASSTSISIPPG